MSTWQVILLGLLEGLTEFIPVSSTGHLLLAGYFLGFNSPGKTFEVLIQLGSILAILSVYSAKLLRLLIDLPSDPRSRRFVLAVLVAFLPVADVQGIALGFVVAFVSGVVVVRYLLDFVSSHGFALFAWWRILVGGMGLGALFVLGAASP